MLNHMLLNLFTVMTLLMSVNIHSLLWSESNGSENIEESNNEETESILLNVNTVIQETIFLLAEDKLDQESNKPVTTLDSNRTAEAAEIVAEPELSPEEEQEMALAEWKENFPVYEEESHQTDFIQKIAPAAVLIANTQGIYPSVMIAQAGLESSWGQSGLAENYNNLMGTKGNTEGQSVTVRTREDQNGESVYINAGFTIYESWAHSLYHYGSLMKNGLSWDSEYYSGTWVENTENYQEATAWLQGRYASDTAYASKLNQTIESFDLAQYDEIEPFENELEKPLRELNLEI